MRTNGVRRSIVVFFSRFVKFVGIEIRNPTDWCLQSIQRPRNIDVLGASLTAGDASES